jgi:SAM-dependent methyltransferase
VSALYDTIGRTYARYRRPDPRIAKLIDEALGDAASVVSIGSGTGSYEPGGRRTVAVEPSQVMIGQRPPGIAPVIRAVAEHLPIASDSFDVALAVLTVHHWPDHVAGLREMQRVAPKQVVLTWDPSDWESFWLVADYIPEIPKSETGVGTLNAITEVLQVDEVKVIRVPRDCTDGFAGAYWRRPEMYLDPDARAAISGFARCAPDVVEKAMARLGREICDGTWESKYGHLRDLDEIDLGYRLVIASR